MRRMILPLLLVVGSLLSFAPLSSAQDAAPSVALTSPSTRTFETNEPSITLQGTVTANAEVRNVIWVSQFGKRGVGTFTVTGATSAIWEIPAITLRPGINLISVTVVDAENHSVSTDLVINRKVPTGTQQSLPILTRQCEGQPIQYQAWKGMAVIEHDNMLGPVAQLGSTSAAPPRTPKTVTSVAVTTGTVTPDALSIIYTSNLWPAVGGLVQIPYTISGSAPNLTSAITQFNADFSGFIELVPQGSQTNVVNITVEGGNGEGMSDVGMIGGPQMLTCGTGCSVATWLHEFGHTLGLLHEHQRPDRASYITLNLANADLPNVPGNFTLFTSDFQTSGLFDLASIMEYATFDLSKAGLPVIESIPPGMPLSNDTDYSSGDRDGINRLYGRVPSQVTVTTNPPGLSVIVDSETFATTPQTFSWALNSTHTIAVPPDPQTLNPSDGSTYAFGAWNDLGASSHTVTVEPGSGSLTDPVTAPAVTVYEANYIRLQPFAFASPAAAPSGSGTASVSPQPTSEFGGAFFADRTLISVSTTSSGVNSFYEWFGVPFPASDNPHPFYIQAPTSMAQAVYVTDPVTYLGASITGPNTWNPGLNGLVDGVFAYLPSSYDVSFNGSAWIGGSTHTISVDQAQSPVTTNVFYNWNSWSDNLGITHTITQPNSGTQTITGSFTPFYATYTVPPPLGQNGSACSGGVATTPPGTTYSQNTAFDFYQDGTQVTSTATPNSAFPGFLFAGWSGSLTGTTNPDTVTIHDQFVPTASFNTIAAPLAITSFSPATASATASAMDLTINGTGFTTSTFLNWNSSPRSLTFVSSTQLTLHLVAGDLANPGGQAIFMGNNVVNSSSVTCGVDILSSFIVTSAVAPTLKSIVVTPANPSIAKGATQQFTATGTFSDGTTQNLTSTATWSSGTTATATISTTGLATGAGVGTSTITATSSSISGSTLLTVTAATLQSIAVTPANPSIAKGATQQFTATGTFSNGTTQNLTSTVTWSSGTTATATISTAGLASGAGVGTSTIKATSGAISGSTLLTVTAATLQSIAVTPANPSIAKGATQQFTATGTFSDGTTQNLTSTVTWSSGTTTAATISAAGLANGAGVGTSTITATSSSITGSTLLTVTAATLQSIAVTPANPSIAKGAAQQFTATGTFSDGTTQNVTSSVTWSSGTTTTATINAAGLATGAGVGTSTITATSSSISGSTLLTVTAATLQSIAVTPTNPSIVAGT